MLASYYENILCGFMLWGALNSLTVTSRHHVIDIATLRHGARN